LSKAIDEGLLVKCVTLRGFKGLLTWKTQTDTYFSKEISDRVRVIACLTTLPNIIHSDSYENTLSTLEGLKIRKSVGAKDDDTLVLVWGNQQDSEMGANEIVIRAKEATIGIPSETRQALRDGTNGFERILPGPDRMYPDTDLPPKRITKERLDNIKSQIQKPFWENENWYNQIGVPKDLIRDLSGSKFAKLFETCIKDWNLEPKVVATALIQFPKRLKKKNLDSGCIGEKEFRKLFEALKENKIVKDSILQLMTKIINNGGFKSGFIEKPSQKNDLMKAYKRVTNDLKKIKIYKEDKKEKIIVGKMMEILRSKVNGKIVAEFVLAQEKGAE
jgi:glutamyl-tRNA(Gln) amidotransferase subunit E